MNTTKAFPVETMIEKNHEAFISDPDYATSLKKLDKAKLREGTKDLRDNIAILVNYHVFKRHLRAAKIVKGHLGATAEKSLVSRGKEARQAFEQVSKSFSVMGQAIGESGFSTVVERHIGSLCKHLDRNPKVLNYLVELEDMGITKSEISCVTEELRKKDFNILRYGGADGTFASFIGRFGHLHNDFCKELDVIEKHGLPTITGAGGDSTTTGVAIGFAVAAGILCLITAFYA